MILINQHLEKDKTYKSHIDMFPRLYYQNFDGKYQLVRHISVKIINGNVDVQTDLTDSNEIKKYLDTWLESERSIAEQKLHEAEQTLKAIQEVML